MVARWEADGITGLNDGDSVATWPDQSGSARDATQLTTLLQPIFHTNIFGTAPAVQFTAHKLLFTAVPLTNFTVFAVCIPFSDASYSTAMLTWSLLTGGDFSGFMLNGQFFHITTLNAANAETHNFKMNNGLVNGTKHIAVWTYDGTTVVARDNGASQTTTSVDGGYGNVGGVIGFCFASFVGKLGAILVYNSVLSAGNISLMETYLNTKYPCF